MAIHTNLCRAAGGDAAMFDEATLSWVSIAEASVPALSGLPALHGELATDPDSLAIASRDYGRLVNDLPMAVLRPASIDDVQAIVAYANDQQIAVAVRGAGHSTFGQAQAGGGIVIDMTSLREVHSVTSDAIVVDAGASWQDVVVSAYGAGAVPRILPDRLDSTVGGVLAVGGVTRAAHRWGLATDNVRELEVVTGAGQRMVCSSTQDAGLFDAALGGLGQCAVIVRATLPLEPWRSAARIYTLVYEHLSDLVDAHRRLAREGRFDRLVGTVHTRADEGWTYLLCATTFFEHSSAPQDDPLLDGIAERAVNVVSQDKDFKGWLSASFAGANHLTNVGLSDVPHPDLDVVLPDETVQTFMIGLLSALNPDELAGLPVTLVAIPREKTRSSVRMPDADLSFAVSVPRSIGEGADVTAFETMLATNRHLFERARELGGTRQATGAIPFTQDDWAAHFGAGYESFSRNKDAFDPKGLLAPGARMWSPRRAAPAPAHVLR